MKNTIQHPKGYTIAILLALGQFACGSSTSEGMALSSSLCAETFSPCGGDPTGTWNVVGVCLDGDLAAAYNADSYSKHPECSSQTKEVRVGASGSATYTSGADAIVSHQATRVQEVKDSYSSDCAAAAFSVTTLDAGACAQIQQTLQAADSQKKVSCSMSAGNCDCTSTTTQEVKAQNMFEISGSTITESDDRTYSICIRDNKMTQGEVKSGSVNIVTSFQKK